MGRDSATSLAPGFRFHPTDEELVRYYLKRKVCGKSFRFDAISDVDVYKNEPWDLPGKSKLKTRDLEWYFFSALDKKYGNGSRTNRATEKGYWKTTGKDRAVQSGSRVFGMKKTLVYHEGRAPRGKRSNWVMHEYRLTDEDLEKTGIAQDAFVLCRIFQKSGPGPKNGEKYGAPFIEEEWEDEHEVAYFPGEEAPMADEAAFDDYVYFDVNELDQSLDLGVASDNVQPPPIFYYGESSNCVEQPRDSNEDLQKPEGTSVETCGDVDGGNIRLDDSCGNVNDSCGNVIGSLPVKDEYVNELNNMDSSDINYLLDEPYLDASDIHLLNDGLFLETNDLSNPNEAVTSNTEMLDEYLTFFDVDGDNIDNMLSDPFEIVETENPTFDQASLADKPVNEGTETVCMPSEDPVEEACGGASSSSSKKIPDADNFKSEMDYPFIKKASHMLGNLHAPPAFAAEFPSKEALRKLNSAAQSSGSVHVTAGIIRISNLAISGSEADWSTTKNMVLPFGSTPGVPLASLVPVSSLLSCKTGHSMSRGILYLLFMWIFILSISFRVGSIFGSRNILPI